MRFDTDTQAAPVRPRRRAARRGVFLVMTALLLACSVATPPTAAASTTQPPAAEAGGHPQSEAVAEVEGEHAEGSGALSMVAKLLNFAILAGVLVYFLKTPLAGYLATRSTQISQDLVTAAEMRAAATTQLAEIARKLQELPAELDVLRAQGAEDVVAERARIDQAASAERDRLLDHTRREIDMQLRVARRDLVEYAAQLAVDVAEARIRRTITHDDQLRLADRYAAQLTEAR